MTIVLLREPGFPTVDAPAIAERDLDTALPGAIRCTAAGLAAALGGSGRALLVLPYGSAFPIAAWDAILAHLAAGGRWLSLGGSPLARPVRRDGGGWHVGVATRAYAQRLGIQQAYRIALDAAEPAPGVAMPDVDPLGTAPAWALQLRLAELHELPEETGTEGQREGRVRPLVLGRARGCHVASPALLIDRDRGEFAGGRWVIAPTEAPLRVAAIAELARLAMARRIRVTVDTGFASFHAGETPRARVRVECDGDARLPLTLRVARDGKTLHEERHVLQPRGGAAEVASGALPTAGPGLYRIEVEAGDRGEVAREAHGFWIRDEALLAGVGRIGAAGDYFTRDGRPFPVTGTTYMSTVSHRRFLLEPSPSAWHDDFAAMRAAGINVVRTGLWFAWKAHVHEDGAAREDVLRALEAFLHSARSHGIAVIVNLFAFVPPSWGGGANPWLDRASLAAQSTFVASFVRRFAAVPDLMWDFINEPSVTAPAKLWKTRPNHDAAEQSAWTRWLGSADADEWRERFRLRADQPLTVPAEADFTDSFVFTGGHPLRAAGFNRFAQEAFRHWLAAMARAVREQGGSTQPIMVGQDEGGTEDRPNSLLFHDLVDATCNHPWWRNDDLLWNAIVAKVAGKPLLMQEAGLMFYEGLDRAAWRTPERARNLLERKLALSFAAGASGFVEWLWNTDHYNVSDNEAGIGMLRPDGSQKPELAALSTIAGFVARHAERFRGRVPERCCVVLPLAAQALTRNLSVPATRRAVRALEYHLGIACRAVPDVRAHEAEGAELVVLPAARAISDACWDALLALVERGATLVASGFLDSDEWLRPAPRLERLGIRTAPVTVHRDEVATLAHGTVKTELRATFDGESVQRLHKAGAPDGGRIDARVVQHGRGRIVWCPLPIELAQGEAQTAEFYRAAAAIAGLATREGLPGLLVRPVELADATLWIVANESGADAALRDVAGLGAWAEGIVVPADRTLLALAGRDGRLIEASTPPVP